MIKTKSTHCTNCILSSHFPQISFDEKGVCNFCNNEMINLTAKDVIKNAEEKLEKLFKEKKGVKTYDAIVCFSGGKDSTYTLKLAKEKYGLKLLAFTLDNGYLSNYAKENIENVVDLLNIDHIYIKPGKQKLKKLFKASALFDIYTKKSLVRISSVCYSCISMVNIFALKIALEKRIPFIISGFNLGQIPLNGIVYKNNYKFLEESRKKSIDLLKGYCGEWVKDYLTISDELLNSVEEYPYSVNILCLENIDELEIVEEIKKIGWVVPDDVDGCSSNCLLNTFNNYVHQIKYGYNPYELELSHLIRQKQLTRDEAIKKIYKQPVENIQLIMNDLGINEEELEKYFSDRN